MYNYTTIKSLMLKKGIKNFAELEEKTGVKYRDIYYHTQRERGDKATKKTDRFFSNLIETLSSIDTPDKNVHRGKLEAFYENDEMMLEKAFKLGKKVSQELKLDSGSMESIELCIAIFKTLKTQSMKLSS